MSGAGASPAAAGRGPEVDRNQPVYKIASRFANAYLNHEVFLVKH